jgi:ribonuclease HI
LVIQDPSKSQWTELEYPISGLTTTLASEIEAIRKAIEYVYQHYTSTESRVVILSDSKFAVNSILYKWNSESYETPVTECQKLLKELGERSVPEIFWIKGHCGIPGNERADILAKNARLQATINQPDLYCKPNKCALFLNFQGLNPSFTKEWNRHWINEGDDIQKKHQRPKQILRNLVEAQSFENTVLHNIEVHERRILCRIITGKVGLNGYLFKINRSETPNCKWCREGKEEETVEHFLFECSHYVELRSTWRAAVQVLLPQIRFSSSNLRKLVVGCKTWKPEKRIKVVKELCKFVVASRRKI